MKTQLLAFLFILLLAGAAPAAVTFTGDFETGDFKGWFTEFATPEHLKIVTDPVRAGKYAARFWVTRTQQDVAGSKRAEVMHHNSGGPTTQYADCWFGWSLYVPADWKVDPESPEIVAQWHERPDFDLGEKYRSPPESLQIMGNQWRMDTRWDTRPKTLNNKPEGMIFLPAGAIDFGQWTDWVMHIRWSFGQDGLLELWKNGEKVIDYKGPNGYNDRQQTFFKAGIYKWDWKKRNTKSVADEHVIYLDEVRFGDKASSYEDVAPKPVKPRRQAGKDSKK